MQHDSGNGDHVIVMKKGQVIRVGKSVDVIDDPDNTYALSVVGDK